jgi:hypothetical protein
VLRGTVVTLVTELLLDRFAIFAILILILIFHFFNLNFAPKLILLPPMSKGGRDES